MLHVPRLLGARWVAKNHDDIAAAGGDPETMTEAFGSGLVGTHLMELFEVPEDDLEAVVTGECLAWLAGRARRRAGRAGPSFDVFFAHAHHPNGDHGFVVTMAPPPPRAWRAAFERRLHVSTATEAPVVRLGGRPVLRVANGRLRWWWRESAAFRRQASLLRARSIREHWREHGWRGRLPADPYSTDRAKFEARQARARRAIRREADDEIRPLLERFGLRAVRQS